MKIVLIGAGQVGGTLAENLASEANDITVIDPDGHLLRELQDRLDIRTVAGHGSHPDILVAAGIEDADMLVAVTNSDEVNMTACQVAHSLFRTPTKIARVRSGSYTHGDYRERLFGDKNMPVDVLITPEQVVTDFIYKLLEHPGTLQALDFAGGAVQLIAIRVRAGGPMVGHPLMDIGKQMPGVEARAAAIWRRDRPIVPTAETVIREGDEVFFVASSANIRKVMKEIRRTEKPYRRVMIAGGGNIGYRLARTLEHHYHVKVIEYDAERGEYLAEHLDKAVVLQGQAANRELLLEENIDTIDVFVAVTNDDEVNIMASLLAKRLGVRKVMTLITNPVYADLMQGSEIDIAISPQQATTSSLLSHVRRGDTLKVHSLRRGAAEALEIVAHGDAKTSKVIGRCIEDINLPPGATIGALVRGKDVIIAHHNTEIEPEDHVIVFMTDKSHIRDIEKLFQVGFTFF